MDIGLRLVAIALSGSGSKGTAGTSVLNRGLFDQSAFQCKAERGGGRRLLLLGERFGVARVDEFAAGVAAFGADLENPVRFGDYIGMMLDDDDRVALVDERMEQLDEATAVGLVQADGRLFQDVEVRTDLAAGALAEGRETLGQFADELEPLASPPERVGLLWPSVR